MTRRALLLLLAAAAGRPQTPAPPAPDALHPFCVLPATIDDLLAIDGRLFARCARDV
jgi:hypothetical protein